MQQDDGLQSPLTKLVVHILSYNLSDVAALTGGHAEIFPKE